MVEMNVSTMPVFFDDEMIDVNACVVENLGYVVQC
jgi:hypothetical protein